MSANFTALNVRDLNRSTGSIGALLSYSTHTNAVEGCQAPGQRREHDRIALPAGNWRCNEPKDESTKTQQYKSSPAPIEAWLCLRIAALRQVTDTRSRLSEARGADL